MDLPVLALKFRDYIFWLGPLYLLALALDGATIVCFRQLLRLPRPPQAEGKVKEVRLASARLGAASALDGEAIIFQIAWHVAGRPSGSWRVSTRFYIWAALVSRSASWTALLLTSLISWPLSLMRLGFGILLASLLALFTPLLVDPGRGGGIGDPSRVGSGQGAEAGGAGGSEGIMIVPVLLDEGQGVSQASVLREWWRAAQTRFEATSDILLLGTGLGAAFIAVSPNVTALLKAGLVAPLSQVAGTAIGLLVPLLPGTELPLVVAMQSRGIEGGAIAALLLVVTVSSWRLARDLHRQLGAPIAVRYLVVTGLTSLLLTVVALPLFGLIGAL